MKHRVLLAVMALGGVVAQGGAVVGGGFPPLGKIAPRSAQELSGSSWSVGAETMDHDSTSQATAPKLRAPLASYSDRREVSPAHHGRKVRGIK